MRDLAEKITAIVQRIVPVLDKIITLLTDFLSFLDKVASWIEKASAFVVFLPPIRAAFFSILRAIELLRVEVREVLFAVEELRAYILTLDLSVFFADKIVQRI